MSIAFEQQEMVAEVPALGAGGGAWKTVSVLRRIDPLTGRGARIIPGIKLKPPTRPDLSVLTAKPPFCPFCEEFIEQATVGFPPSLTPEGRIRRGRAVVVPNVLAYASHSAVCIYDTRSHFTDLNDMTAEVLGDMLDALLVHTRAVRHADPAASWGSINANYLQPAGASLVHPHVQSCHDAIGLTFQRDLVERCAARGGSYFEDLIAQEESGPRWIARRGRVAWLTPFAPGGFHEVWAIVSGAADLTDLTNRDARDLADGLECVLAAYDSWNLTSFNFGLAGGGPSGGEAGFRVLLRVVSRSNAEPYYRSDASYFERLYHEAMLDAAPEETASALRPFFDRDA